MRVPFLEQYVPKYLVFVGTIPDNSCMSVIQQRPLDFIKTEFLKRCQKNPRYSQSAFARDLGLSRGELNELLSGKRKLSHKNLSKISQKIGLTSFEHNHLLNSLDTKKPIPKSHDLEKLELLANPLVLNIFTLSDVSSFRWNPEWIAKRLGCRALEVKLAIDKLVTVGVLKKNGQTYEIILTQLSYKY